MTKICPKWAKNQNNAIFSKHSNANIHFCYTHWKQFAKTFLAMFYLSTNLQWCARYRRKIDIAAFAVPGGILLNRCSWRHLLFSAVYFNCYRNSELPVTRIARSLVQEIVISFLPKETWKFSLEKTKFKISYCVLRRNRTFRSGQFGLIRLGLSRFGLARYGHGTFRYGRFGHGTFWSRHFCT